MSEPRRSSLPARVHELILSVPVWMKILGVGAVVAALFGTVTLHQLDAAMAPIFSGHLTRIASSMATSLSDRVERPLVTGDLLTVRSIVLDTLEAHPDVRYALVQDPHARVLAHTFEGQPPSGLLAAHDPAQLANGGAVVVLRGDQGYIFDGAARVLGGRAGMVRIGLSDQTIVAEMGAMLRPVRLALILCALLGGLLAMALTAAIVRPIRQLVGTTREIAAGHLDARATVSSRDEIGDLAASFNRMAEALASERAQVARQEEARQELIHRIISTQEEERGRIARDLHDELGQSLSALLMLARDGCVGDEARAAFESRIRAMIEQVRGIAWTLRPSILSDYGLSHALARHVEEVAAAGAISIDFEVVGDAGERLPDEVETVLYRVTQEALGNVLRHARPTRVSVLLIRRQGEISVLVEDDGVGFDARAIDALPSTATLGIAGMRERLTLVGGSLTIESELGRGTTVRAVVPVEAEPEDVREAS